MRSETMQLWLDCYSIKNIALKTGQTCEQVIGTIRNNWRPENG